MTVIVKEIVSTISRIAVLLFFKEALSDYVHG